MVRERDLKEATDDLVGRFSPNKVILFGSWARGTADEHSDVDLLVVCSLARTRSDLWNGMDQVLRERKLASDIVILTPEEFESDLKFPGTIARYASREGKILYDRPV